jgi:SAM-dependent methyltransferase
MITMKVRESDIPAEEVWEGFFEPFEVLSALGIDDTVVDVSVDYVMLFNILHDERPERILNEAYRILRPKGSVGIIHWNYDSGTPRGPPMDIRPKPEQCYEWALKAGFTYLSSHDLKPYHYGFVFAKPQT